MTEIHNAAAKIEAAYNATSKAYASHFLGELEHKPLDRALLDAFAEETRAKRVCDIGTGPGHIARYLNDRGVLASGIDLAAAMIEEASMHHPHIEFQVGDMLALQHDNEAFDGITAFYAIVHLVRAELPHAFKEWFRVLRNGCPVLLSFHVGREAIHLREFLSANVDLAWNFFSMGEVNEALEHAGFVVEARIERRAYACEHPSVRGYILARKPLT